MATLYFECLLVFPSIFPILDATLYDVVTVQNTVVTTLAVDFIDTFTSFGQSLTRALHVKASLLAVYIKNNVRALFVFIWTESHLSAIKYFTYCYLCMYP